jgi:hypothetical protein
MTFADFESTCERNGRRCWSLSQGDDGDWLLVVVGQAPGLGRCNRLILGANVESVLEAGASCPLRTPNTPANTPLRVVPAPPPRPLYRDIV